jgi:hypothetical protein
MVDDKLPGNARILRQCIIRANVEAVAYWPIQRTGFLTDRRAQLVARYNMVILAEVHHRTIWIGAEIVALLRDLLLPRGLYLV